VRPTRRLLWLAAAWLVLGGLASAWPVLGGAWLGVAAGLLLAGLVEALLLSRVPLPLLSRRLPGALALGEPHEVGLRLENPGLRAVSVEAFEEAPPELEAQGWPQRATVRAGGWVELQGRLVPRSRGSFVLPAVHLSFPGPLGLLTRVRRVAQADTVRVFPNFKAVARYALLAVDRRQATLGVHLRRRRGQGLEFHQLREFREGDSLRQIDWKAVSRRDQLISRDYREESDQQVILLLDCGRHMRALDGEVTHFDRVLDAALLLAYVALRQGDAVGIQTWSGPDRWLPPQKGAGAMTTLLERLYDLQPTLQPSDPAEAARRLASRQKRRALVVLLTNLRDDDASALPQAFAALRRRHLVLVASLREAALDQRLAQPATDLAGATAVAATWSYLEARRAAHELVRAHGMHTLDVEPRQLPVALVGRYLEFKRGGAL